MKALLAQYLNNFRIAFRLVVPGIFIVFTMDANAASVLSDSLLKAIYTYKFANFTQWPETKLDEDTASIHFCIIGASPFSVAEVAEIEGKPVKQRPLSVLQYPSGVISGAALQACHIAFISTSEKKRLSALLEALKPYPVLTVSDLERFSEAGGMITLIRDQNRIHFEVNVAQVRQSRLRVSSKVLEFSRIVQTARLDE